MQSKQPDLPYEALQLIAAFDSERQETAWDLAMTCVITQYDRYNIQATTNNPRNPYEALLYERSARYGEHATEPRAFRARATMYREMIFHSTQPHINTRLANWWGEHLRLVHAFLGRTETTLTKYAARTNP